MDHIVQSIARLNSDKFQSFHFKAKLSFLRESHTNDYLGEFPDFHPIYDSPFCENGQSNNGYFHVKFKKSYIR